MGSQRIKELFLVSKQVSESAVLTQQLIDEMEGRTRASLLSAFRSALEKIRLQDLGIGEDDQEMYFLPRHITYVSVYETQSLSICIFCLSEGTSMPLHDHPQMTAFTRILKGKMRFKLADLLGQEKDEVYSYRELRSGEVAAPGILSLTPESGNLHQFEALENTVMLDVFIPNYSQLRDVTYFVELSDRLLTVIKEIDINFREVEYCGELVG